MRITDREYWAKRKGQATLDEENNRRAAQGIPLEQTEYLSKSSLSNMAFPSMRTVTRSASSSQNKKNRTVASNWGPTLRKKHIDEVLAENAKSHQAGPYQAYSIRLIVDLENCIKAQQNQYYARKVKIGNLKQMAGTLAFL